MNPEYFIGGLVKRGMPDHIAKGFVANFMAESGLNPGINEAAPVVPGSRGGYGLYQLTGPRRKQYEAWAADKGADIADPEAQMDFLMLELGTTERGAWDKIQAASDPIEAARLVSEKFLRPGVPHLDKRLKFAAGLAGVSAPTGMEAEGPGRTDRNPARLAWAYANGKMSPEDAALYERGMSEGLFPKASKPEAPPPPEMPNPLDTYASIAMRPRTPFQPVALDAGPIRNATPFGRS